MYRGSWNIFLIIFKLEYFKGLIHIFDQESPSPALVCRFAVSSKPQSGCEFEDNLKFLNFTRFYFYCSCPTDGALLTRFSSQLCLLLSRWIYFIIPHHIFFDELKSLLNPDLIFVIFSPHKFFSTRFRTKRHLIFFHPGREGCGVPYFSSGWNQFEVAVEICRLESWARIVSEQPSIECSRD